MYTILSKGRSPPSASTPPLPLVDTRLLSAHQSVLSNQSESTICLAFSITIRAHPHVFCSISSDAIHDYCCEEACENWTVFEQLFSNICEERYFLIVAIKSDVIMYAFL